MSDKTSNRKAKPRATLGGKFNSTGTADDMERNLALVTRLVGQIGQDGEKMLTGPDATFFEDVRYKLQGNERRMFGWRQVEALQRISQQVEAQREQERKRAAFLSQPAPASTKTDSPSASSNGKGKGQTGNTGR